jgi:selenocysteine-specific elongation factor
MIVATAGHVDHGKTRLVEALTGVDTDTLAEEKKRGLSINIGFAYLPVDTSTSIGFIDVPGHDRFIKNALCGLAAADFVLLVIAADDGPMPQTEEHLSIIDLLGVRRGAIVINKVDRVSAARVAELKIRIGDLTKGTTIESAPLYCVSANTGDGVDSLRNHLLAQVESKTPYLAETYQQNNFRLAVDRAFIINGVGLIVTGTIFSGEIRIDDRVKIAGTGMRLRVRGLRVQSQQATSGRQGQRCAINLAGTGLRKDLIGRGSWVTSDRVPSPVDRFDARIRVLPQNLRPLAHWTPVHLHLAASEVTARVAVLAGKSIELGATGLVQIVLDQPLGAVFADRFIIRDQSARITIGGGHVLDIFPPKRGRARAERIEWLTQLHHGNAHEALFHLLNTCPHGVNLEQFSANRNLTEHEESTAYDAVAMEVMKTDSGRIGFSSSFWQQRCNAILQAKELKLTSPQNRLNTADELIWNTVETILSARGLRPLSVAEIAKESSTDTRELLAFLKRAGRDGLITRISATLVTKPAALRKIFALLEKLARQADDGVFTVAAFRDACGIGRNRCIEMLEFFDARRITIRVDNGRRLLGTAEKAFASILNDVS